MHSPHGQSIILFLWTVLSRELSAIAAAQSQLPLTCSPFHRRAKGPIYEPACIWATLVRFSRICEITQILRHESIAYLPGKDLPLGCQGLAGAMIPMGTSSESPELSRAWQLVHAVLDGILASREESCTNGETRVWLWSHRVCGLCWDQLCATLALGCLCLRRKVTERVRTTRATGA